MLSPSVLTMEIFIDNTRRISCCQSTVCMKSFQLSFSLFPDGSFKAVYQQRDCFPNLISDGRCHDIKLDSSDVVKALGDLDWLPGEGSLSGTMCTCNGDKCLPCSKHSTGCERDPMEPAELNSNFMSDKTMDEMVMKALPEMLVEAPRGSSTTMRHGICSNFGVWHISAKFWFYTKNYMCWKAHSFGC